MKFKEYKHSVTLLAYITPTLITSSLFAPFSPTCSVTDHKHHSDPSSGIPGAPTWLPTWLRTECGRPQVLEPSHSPRLSLQPTEAPLSCVRRLSTFTPPATLCRQTWPCRKSLWFSPSFPGSFCFFIVLHRLGWYTQRKGWGRLQFYFNIKYLITTEIYRIQWFSYFLFTTDRKLLLNIMDAQQIWHFSVRMQNPVSWTTGNTQRYTHEEITYAKISNIPTL